MAKKYKSYNSKITVALLINDEGVLREVNEIINKHYPSGMKGDSYIQIVGRWTDFTLGLKAIGDFKPTITIIGVCIKDDTGVASLARRVADLLPDTCIFVIGAEKDPDIILKVMMAGCKEFLTSPLESPILEGINRVGESIEFKSRGGSSIIGVATFKGGSGASVLSLNLAVALKLLNHKDTLLVDGCIGGGDIALYLNIKHKYTLRDVMQNLNRLDTTLLSGYSVEHSSGVDVIPSLGFMEHLKEVSSDLFKDKGAVQFLFDFLKTEYSYIVIDVGHVVSPDTIDVLKLMDATLLVMTLDIASINNTKEGLLAVEKAGFLEKTHLVVNRYDKRYANGLTAISVDDVVKTLGMPVLCTIPNDYFTVVECVNLGLVAVTDKRKSVLAGGFLDLAELVSKEIVGTSVSQKD